MEWQPIETAPKDGTTIAVAAFCDFNQLWVFRQDYWRAHADGNGGWGAWHHNRTHWMPLPAPPKDHPHAP